MNEKHEQAADAHVLAETWCNIFDRLPESCDPALKARIEAERDMASEKAFSLSVAVGFQMHEVHSNIGHRRLYERHCAVVQAYTL